MIVTIVTETFPPDVNGVAMTLGRLLSGLGKRNHKVQLVCTHSTERDATMLPSGVSYYPTKGLSIPRYSEAKFGLPAKKLLAELWFSQRPDVIYVATEGPLGLSAIKLAKELKIPTLSGFHTNFQAYSQHYGFGLISHIIERYLVSLHNKSGMTLTPTIGQKNKLIDMGIKNVSVLGRGVDTLLFTPSKRSMSLRLSWGVVNEHDSVMLYVGRIAAEKNLNLAIKTYNMMKEINKEIKFVLVGDGPLLKSMQKDNPGFIFAGMKKSNELAKYYASCDIFIFPSVTETFGNVVLEAMASGLGVVAYDYAAANMHIKHGVNGIVAPVNQSSHFIRSACDYLNNMELLQEVRESARLYASKQSWAEINNKFECFLKEQAYQSHSHFMRMVDVAAAPLHNLKA